LVSVFLLLAGAQRRARRERARAHAEARAERWRDVSQKVATAGAAAVVAAGIGDVGAHPLAACFALRIDALHGEARQVLHFSPSVAASLGPMAARPNSGTTA